MTVSCELCFLLEIYVAAAQVGTYDISKLDATIVQNIEADSFWCVSALLDAIQDNYTFSMPGIQRNVHKLSTLMSRIDCELSFSIFVILNIFSTTARTLIITSSGILTICIPLDE
jgi:hypothetical protein